MRHQFLQFWSVVLNRLLLSSISFFVKFAINDDWVMSAIFNRSACVIRASASKLTGSSLLARAIMFRWWGVLKIKGMLPVTCRKLEANCWSCVVSFSIRLNPITPFLESHPKHISRNGWFKRNEQRPSSLNRSIRIVSNCCRAGMTSSRVCAFALMILFFVGAWLKYFS